MLLGFSAYMCLGSCWYSQANEVVAFSFLLFAAENTANHGRWFYLVLAVVVISLVSSFHLYLGALLLLFYVPARLIERHSWSPLPILRSSGLLAAAALLGVGLGAIVILPNFYSLLNSPRGSGTTGNIWPSPSLFQIDSILHYFTALLRPYSNDILGTADEFRGWRNYLEAPATYCGLFSLLMFPQVFINTPRRQRILYGGLLCLMVLPIIFPWFRHLIWLFQGGYYRAFSLFSVFGIITLSMAAFSRFIDNRQLSLWLLGATLIALIGILCLPIAAMQTLIDPAMQRTCGIFLFLYAILLALGQILKRQRLVGGIIIAFIAVELIHFDRITVSNREMVTKKQLTERVGYNDETTEAISDIKASDDSFFRVTKTWGSGPALHGSLNDAMVFGYNGTPSYSSFNNLNYIKFLMAVDAIPRSDLANRAQWSTGLVGHKLLAAFACEKYVLTKNPVILQSMGDYELLKTYGRDIYLFRNALFLPLGLTFTHYLTEGAFLSLPAQAKPLALLHAVILSESDLTRLPELTELTINELRQHSDETSMQGVIADRHATSLNVRSCKDTHIDGTVAADGNRILVVQTPFDLGWHATIDGRTASTLVVNAGLLGIPLVAGEHRIELHYRPPFLYFGAIVSLLSCCIFLGTLWSWPRN
jgi:uncharacterized membrane protein YfhO